MSPLNSARINGHDPYADLKDVLERLATLNAAIHEQPLLAACRQLRPASEELLPFTLLTPLRGALAKSCQCVVSVTMRRRTGEPIQPR